MTPITKKIGVLGTGQLGRMLAMAGCKLGQKFLFCSGMQDSPSKMGNFNETDDLRELAAFANVVTYESENVPLEWLEEIRHSTKVIPDVNSLIHSQHRGKEKELFRHLEIPTAAFRVVNSAQALIKAVETMGLPIILKTTRGGYDGKGQILVTEEDQLIGAWYELETDEAIAEVRVSFTHEVSIIGARDADGNMQCYPLSMNMHDEGILRLSMVPSPDVEQVQQPAEKYLRLVMEHLDHVGIMALELFVTRDKLIANEIAPRVHNSGHWSIDAALTSQFDNHIRCLAGIELGSTAMTSPYAVMVNIIGEYKDLSAVLKNSNINCHLYDKAEREKRKIGHLTCQFDSIEALRKDSWNDLTPFLPLSIKQAFEAKFFTD